MIDTDAPLKPNAAPLDWSDPDPAVRPSMWAMAVSVAPHSRDTIVAALVKLHEDLGDVETRFLHFTTPDDNDVSTMFVDREETEALRPIAGSHQIDPAGLSLARFLAERAIRLADPDARAVHEAAMQDVLRLRNERARKLWPRP